MNLKNKIIIVTGASEGIGKQIVLRLSKSGAMPIMLSRNEEKLKIVKKEIQELGGSSDYYVCDLRDLKDLKSTVENISKKYKKVDGLINNAGVWQKLGKLEDIPDQEILDTLQTNIRGLIFLTKYTMPLLKKADSSIIINVSSRSGYSAQAGQSVYTATKYGVRGFTEVLQQDLKGSGIRVAGVYQGGTNTKMFEKAGEDWPEENYKKLIPPEEIAEIIVFMASRPKQVWLPEVRVESK